MSIKESLNNLQEQLVKDNISSDEINNLKNCLTNTIKYINKVETDLQNKTNDISKLKDQLREKNTELREFDKLVGFTEDMSIKDKRKHKQKCEKDEKLILESLKDVDPEIKKEYEEDLIKEEDIVELALEQNKLQFEIHELFEDIKSNIVSTEIESFKQYKRDLYRIIEGFYSITKQENKNQVFEILEEIVYKEGQVYIIDEKIKSM